MDVSILSKALPAAAVAAGLGLAGPATAQERISISSAWGRVTAALIDSDTARSFARSLPISIAMRDHLRQEKTGSLPAPLTTGRRQRDFAAGTLGVWGSRDVVIYYRAGQVPEPGIMILGKVDGDVSIFDRPGSVTVKIERVR